MGGYVHAEWPQSISYLLCDDLDKFMFAAGEANQFCGECWNVDAVNDDRPIIGHVVGAVKVKVYDLTFKVVIGRVNELQTRKRQCLARLRLRRTPIKNRKLDIRCFIV